MDTLLDDRLGPGWIGGDATYSTELPYGHEAFVFSDTLIGTAGKSGRAKLTGVAHNSELVGTIPVLQSDYAGTYASPDALIPDSRDDGDSWGVAATYVENGSQLVFVNELSPVPGSVFDHFAGRSGIAVLSAPANGLPSFRFLTPLPTSPRTQWGVALTQGPEYNYVYGSVSDTSTGAFYGMKVARVTHGQSLDTAQWQYWNGSQWVAGEGRAVPIATGNELTGVTPQEGGVGYEAVSIPGGVRADTAVDVSFACSPAGPWSHPAPVYSIPQVVRYHDEIAYIPTFHPELTGQGGLVVSYNTDSLVSSSKLGQDVHRYQPHFLWLRSSPVLRSHAL